MKFSKLVNILEKVESTTKRLEMIDILSTFFENIKISKDFENIEKIIYLLQGQLVSNIKQFPKMGIAEKMIIEALSVHSGVSPEKIKQVLIKKGDIGSTAELLLSKRKKQKSLLDFKTNEETDQESLEIPTIYTELLKIAKTEGSGSHDIKLGILRGLLRKCYPAEAKYLLKIITGTMRIGVSTQTIIDGIASGLTGDKSNRDVIERAYNLYPDLGDVTRILVQKGINGLREIKISYGIPLRMMLASRVPYAEILEKMGGKCAVEYKLDGERLQIHKFDGKILLFSRRLLEISEQYPDVCENIANKIKADNVVLEGEVVAMDKFYEKMLPFQVLSKRRRKYDVENILKEVPVSLFLFDLLKIDDRDYVDENLPIRRKKLEEITTQTDEIRVVKTLTVSSTEELLEFFYVARKEGTEGIMAKSIAVDSTYQAGNRGFHWIKLKGLEGGKLKDSIDVVIVGAFFGRGRRKGVYGTYIGAVYEAEKDRFVGFTRISSGWTDEIVETLMEEVKPFEVKKKPKEVICEDIPDQWIQPNIVIEIIGDEITKSEKFITLGYSLRFPVFQRFREDKSPHDVTTDKEIEELYKIQ